MHAATAAKAGQICLEHDANKSATVPIINSAVRMAFSRRLKGEVSEWELELDKCIGSGSQASVYAGKRVTDGLPVAIKSVECLESFEIEVKAYGRVKHPNIPRLLDVCRLPHRKYLVLELVHGVDMCDYLNNVKVRFPEGQLRIMARQIFEIVRSCHDAGVIHRDIKLDNLILSSNAVPKIYLVDFGLCAVIEPGSTKRLDKFCGSLIYVAPELLLHEPYDGMKSDVWSCGIVLYCLLYGHFPFQHHFDATIRRQIINSDPDFPDTISKPAMQLVAAMLEKDPAKRPTIHQVLEHDWFTTKLKRKRSCNSPTLTTLDTLPHCLSLT